MDRITELTEKFKKVKLVCDGADILDEIYANNLNNIGEIESIRVVHSFLIGLCVGECMNAEEPFHWFTIFHETIFSMFLDRHGYSMNGNKLIKK